MKRFKQILPIFGLIAFAALFGLIKTLKQRERQQAREERIVLATKRYTIRTAPALKDLPHTSIPMLGKVLSQDSTGTVVQVEFQIQEHNLSIGAKTDSDDYYRFSFHRFPSMSGNNGSETKFNPN